MHTDGPVKQKNQDRFQRYNFAKRIAHTIRNRPTTDSLTVGIYGQWGEGKTSVMEFVAEEIKESAIIMRFNPWHYLDEKQLLIQFFIQLADVLGVRLESWKDKANKTFNKYGGLLSSIPVIPIKKETIEAFSNIFKQTNQQKQIEILKEALSKSTRNIVVLIDDVDRLESIQVQAIFRLVKSIANFPNIIYVLSLDPNRVADALSPVFGDGTAYLEKIIQVPLTLPKAQPAALRQYTYELLNQAINQPGLVISEDELHYFKRNFELYLAKFIQIPRDAVRINNGLSFVLPMLHGEVHMGNLMLLETLKIVQPAMYQYIRDEGTIYLKVYGGIGQHTNYLDEENKKTEAKAIIDKHLLCYSKEGQKLMRSFLTLLFPQLDTLFSNIVYAGDDRYKQWHQQKRVCSGQYFERYFTYDVIEGEISDVIFSDLLATLNSEPINIITEHFENALLEIDIDDFIFKLRFYEDKLSAHQAAQMGRVLCKLGSKFYIKSSFIFNLTTNTVSLIKNIFTSRKKLLVALILLN